MRLSFRGSLDGLHGDVVSRRACFWAIGGQHVVVVMSLREGGLGASLHSRQFVSWAGSVFASVGSDRHAFRCSRLAFLFGLLGFAA